MKQVSIEAAELRIGNVINTPRGNLKVSEVGAKDGIYYARFDGLHEGYFLNVCNPIPLTSELLLKCGFEKDEDECFWMKCEEPKCNGTERTYSIHSFIVHIGSFGSYLWINRYGNVNGALVKLKYLHQLQNLCFTLTGKELVINRI